MKAEEPLNFYSFQARNEILRLLLFRERQKYTENEEEKERDFSCKVYSDNV